MLYYEKIEKVVIHKIILQKIANFRNMEIRYVGNLRKSCGIY